MFLLSRIQEEWRISGDNTAAVASGLGKTGRLITAAAALVTVVFLSFTISGVTSLKMLGFGLALAVIVDATLVRGILVPALMRLAGRANWWAPAPLRAIHRRFGLSDSGHRPATATVSTAPTVSTASTVSTVSTASTAPTVSTAPTAPTASTASTASIVPTASVPTALTASTMPAASTAAKSGEPAPPDAGRSGRGRRGRRGRRGFDGLRGLRGPGPARQSARAADGEEASIVIDFPARDEAARGLSG